VKKIPMLILDGDGIDARNYSEGQTRTRLEAFLEIISQKKLTLRPEVIVK
jgi:benzoyl-CoA reductase/2-hydroxyglutaryl-CoA dehydratase subunit BcrC/BadD/HgdB